MSEPCVFCEIVAGRSPAKERWSGAASLMIEPLNPVTDGHLLVLPRKHVADALESPITTAVTMEDVAVWVRMLARKDPRYASVNLITSVGAPATQSVWHLHIHVVPRTEGDGLKLPWTGQVTS